LTLKIVERLSFSHLNVNGIAFEVVSKKLL
jgi:hypothetical protein